MLLYRKLISCKYAFTNCINNNNNHIEKCNTNSEMNYNVNNIFQKNISDYFNKIKNNDPIIEKLDITIRYKLYILYHISNRKKIIKKEGKMDTDINTEINKIYNSYRLLNSYDSKIYFNYLYKEHINCLYLR